MTFGGFSRTEWCQAHLDSRYKVEGIISLTRKEVYAISGTYMDKYSAPSLFNDQQTQAQALMEFANAEGPEPLSSMC